MTYIEFIAQLNLHYALRHHYLLILAEEAKRPVTDEERTFLDGINLEVAELNKEIEKIDEDIRSLVFEASKEDWFNDHKEKHSRNHSVTSEQLLTIYQAKEYKKDHTGFVF